MTDAAAAHPKHKRDPNISNSNQSKRSNASDAVSVVIKQVANTQASQENENICGKLFLRLNLFLTGDKPAKAATTVVITARTINCILLVIETESNSRLYTLIGEMFCGSVVFFFNTTH